MTRVPDLRDELVAAAARQADSSHRANRTVRALALAAILAVAVATSAAGVLRVTGVLGGDPSAPYPPVPGEEDVGMVRERRPVILGITTLPRSGRVELVGYRIRGFQGRGELLCVDLVFADRTKSGACDRRLPRRASGTPTVSTARGTSKLALGAFDGVADRVDVAYRHGARSRVRRATVIEITATPAARVGASAFSYYIAELPPSARPTMAIARTASGRPLWRARFPR